MIRRFGVPFPTSFAATATSSLRFHSTLSVTEMPLTAATLGLHRVVETRQNPQMFASAQAPTSSSSAPASVLPKQAWRLDATPTLLDKTETLVEVEHLELDATSMAQIVKASSIRGAKAPNEQILDIVERRGKMHNPTTNSGGVCIAKPIEIGSEAPARPGIEVGTRCIPLCSLSSMPLQFNDKNAIHTVRGNQVDIVPKTATGVIMGRIHLVPLPDDMDARVALGAIDGSRLLPQVRRAFVNSEKQGTPIRSCAVVGTGSAGLCALALVRELLPKDVPTKLIGLDMSPMSVRTARDVITDVSQSSNGEQKFKNLDWSTTCFDAQDVSEALQVRNELLDGEGADLVLNCVNVPGTEAATTLLACKTGQIQYFSMSINYQRAILCTDPTGMPLNVSIGAGVFETQPDEAFGLLRRNEALKNFFVKMRTQ